MITLTETPIIHASDIDSQKYLRFIEAPEGETHIVSITLKNGDSFLVAGGACNVGLLPTFAMSVDISEDSTLSELIADIEELETGGNPSGALLSWRGSFCI